MGIEENGNIISHSIHMNDDAELYNSANDVTRRDAIQLLEEYSSKFKWKVSNPRVIDVGSADGSVTNILSKYLPKDYKILIGSDINTESVKFANKRYSNDRIKFIPINIEGDISEDLKDCFDNFFSFYTFQWVRNQEKGFTNIYDMLSANGECFVMYLGYSHIYSLFYALYKSNKWTSFLQGFDLFASPYWDYQDPVRDITKMLKRIGFHTIDVRCKQMVYHYKSVEALKSLVTAINPFNIPKDMWPDFLEDYIKVSHDMGLVDEQTGTIRSEISLPSMRSELLMRDDSLTGPLDILSVKVFNLRLTDNEPKKFAIKISFFDQMILTGVIKSIGARDEIKEKVTARGIMTYDPSDYERMCQFADYPLIVNIEPITNHNTNVSHVSLPRSLTSHLNTNESDSTIKQVDDMSCCNIDILSLFLDKNKICVKKRMEPVFKVPLLQRKSWNNLPLLTMELTIIRNKLNAHHHNILKHANYFKITLAASYNMIFPHDDECIYTATTKTPLNNETVANNVTFNHGHRTHGRFNCTNFQPEWETIRLKEDTYAKSDEKFTCIFEDIHNEDNIDMKYYFKREPSNYTTIWGSFHRTLVLGDTDRQLWEHLRQYNWPLEIQIMAGDRSGYIFMAFLNLTHLLYPGENVVKLAVPLQWANSEQMLAKCGCEMHVSANEKAPSTPGATQKTSKMTTESAPASTSNDMSLTRPTGADESHAFIIVEVKLGRPLKKIVIPPHINKSEIDDMLREMDQGSNKRECTGRGQLDRDWQSTVRCAANSLRRVPYYGTTEFCTFNRQLSETRTHVELSTSCWQDAAIYVNNNFVVQEYLESDDAFDEMLMMAHACLMRTACDTLVGVENWQSLDPTLRAARHARQMQDTAHAVELYLQVVVQKPRDANCWRELATCLSDVDKDWAKVCINKSCVLDPRHPLTLLSRAGMLFEEDPAAAEPFFVALLSLYPFWTTAWVAASAYYSERELFHLADTIMENTKKDVSPLTSLNRLEPSSDDPGYPRSWDRELGDWWDQTPLLPGMSRYYDAADLLLRLRAVELAEVCVARALTEVGESAAYFHLVALCCRLKGNLTDAICHLRLGLEKYGEISYLRSLEAECYNKQGDIKAATEYFAKAGGCIGAYSILLSIPSREQQRTRSVLLDLVRRQPSAYAWVALADDWMMKAAVGEGGDAGGTEEQVAAKNCAAACAVQALKWDRRAGRAWALLATLVQPSARRLHCVNMAISCGYNMSEDIDTHSPTQRSFCQRLGSALRECRCKWCQNLKL